MILSIPCVRCRNVFEIDEQLTGRKVRCRTCGQIQRVSANPPRPVHNESQPASHVYALVPESPTPSLAQAPVTNSSMQNEPATRRKPVRGIHWRRVIHASAGETSLLELEILGLFVLSAADLLVTYALLRRGPAFFESNPVAQWFFVRWNIAGMALFKFSAMGLVVVIGEIVERHRPGWGRGLLLASCLATAIVVFHGLRLLLGHGDNGAPLD
jgi:hypothetical protein